MAFISFILPYLCVYHVYCLIYNFYPVYSPVVVNGRLLLFCIPRPHLGQLLSFEASDIVITTVTVLGVGRCLLGVIV